MDTRADGSSRGPAVSSGSRRWRGRLRFVLAAAASLTLHLLLKRGLEQTTLAVRPPGDAARALAPSFRPRMAADFPLEPDRERRDAPAHERPLDIPVPASDVTTANRVPGTPQRVVEAIDADEEHAADVSVDGTLGLPAPAAEDAAPAAPVEVARDVPVPVGSETSTPALADEGVPGSPVDTVPALPRRRPEDSAGRVASEFVGVSDDADGAPGAEGAAVPSVAPARRFARRPDAAVTPNAPADLERVGIPMAAVDGDERRAEDIVRSTDGSKDEASRAGPSAAGGGLPAPAASALARRSRRSRDGALAGTAALREAIIEPDPDGERLSVTAPAGALAASAGPTRRPPSGVPETAPTGLQRATVSSLPTETRVRETAEAFARRARTLREPTPADAVVERGLAWLARGQAADGRWTLGRYAADGAGGAVRLKSDTAATGLALLAFLGAGYDHFDGAHRDTIRRGLEWLVSVQKEDGDLFLPADPVTNACAWLYSHGIATTALCEAVGMTGDPLLRPAAQKALRFAVAAQQPGRGGWRYQPRADSDLSVSGWMLVALRAGALAGLDVPAESFAGVEKLLGESTIPGGAGRYAYNALEPGQRPSDRSGACMTALGTLMRLHTGTHVRDDAIAAAAASLGNALPAWSPRDRAARDAYLWYYSSQVLVHTGGRQWDAWYGRLTAVLAERQATSGPDAGSWDPLGAVPDRWGAYGGRLYVTTLHLLALEVPYRHLPTYSVSDARPE